MGSAGSRQWRGCQPRSSIPWQGTAQLPGPGDTGLGALPSLIPGAAAWLALQKQTQNAFQSSLLGENL